MCDEPVGTVVETPEGPVEFQDYFVRRRQRDEVGGEAPHRVLVRDGVGKVRLSEPAPVPGFQPGLLPQLALGGAQGLLALGAAAFGDLPGVAFEWVAVLADEVGVAVFDRQDADGDVLVVDHAVDPRLAVRAHDPILAHRDPGVLVDLLGPDGQPGVLPNARDYETSFSLGARRLSSSRFYAPVGLLS